MSLFQKGFNTLANKLTKSAGVMVQVNRGLETLGTWLAIPNISKYEDLGKDGKKIYVVMTQFFFKTSYNYTPQKGDVIQTPDGGVYEVRPSLFRQRFNTEGTAVWHKDVFQDCFIVAYAQKVN